jgi:hypothetical protein
MGREGGGRVFDLSSMDTLSSICPRPYSAYVRVKVCVQKV